MRCLHVFSVKLSARLFKVTIAGQQEENQRTGGLPTHAKVTQHLAGAVSVLSSAPVACDCADLGIPARDRRGL